MADEKNQNQDKANGLENESEQPNIPSSSNTDDFQDDEAIDKLLMDNMFNEPDEFELPEAEQNTENPAEIDEFADIDLDEFSEDDVPEATPLAENSPTSNEQSEAVTGDDSFLDDFDITSDDDSSNFPDEIIIDEFAESTKETPFESQTIQDALNPSNNYQKPAQEPVTDQTSTSEPPQTTNSIIGETLTAQVSQLWAELDELKQQPLNPADDIEKFNKKLKRTVQEQERTNKKNKLFTNIAMAIAALAGIIAIVAFIQNSIINTTITDMNGLISDLEETASGPGDTTEKILKSLKDSYLLLDNNQQSLRIQLATVKNQLNSETTEPDQNEMAVQSTLINLQTEVANIKNKIKDLSTSISKPEKPRPLKTVIQARKSKAKPSANWAVNLISFRQDWYARKKAAEFKNKGIPVEVAPVKVKGEQWYRLRVTGFKTKYEAGSYASRAKKSLNLSSVWITQK